MDERSDLDDPNDRKHAASLGVRRAVATIVNHHRAIMLVAAPDDFELLASVDILGVPLLDKAFDVIASVLTGSTKLAKVDWDPEAAE